MRPRNVLFIVLALLLLVIVLINWSVVSQSTELNLIVAKVNAPLGVLLVLIAAAILAVDFTVHSLNRLRWARERRELTAQIERQRVLADQAEESRIRALTGETGARDCCESKPSSIASSLSDDSIGRRQPQAVRFPCCTPRLHGRWTKCRNSPHLVPTCGCHGDFHFHSAGCSA